MANISRVRVGLSGWLGGPGVCTYYFRDTATAVASLRAMWAVFVGSMPNSVVVQVENAGDKIEEATGVVTGAWTSGPAAVLQGGSAQGFAAPAGLITRWDTEVIADGRRVRGRNFVVPLGVAEYQTDGTINQATRDAFQTAMNSFISQQSTSFVVWHRPRDFRAATADLPELAAHDGSAHLVTAGSIPDRVAILRSRRG